MIIQKRIIAGLTASAIILCLSGCTENQSSLSSSDTIGTITSVSDSSSTSTTTPSSTTSKVQDTPSIYSGDTGLAPDGTMIEYDNTNIVEAYRSGDTSKLDKEELAVYNKLLEILSEVTTDDMTIVEKELAVYDYIIKNCVYDSDHLEAIPICHRETQGPYGCLVLGKSVCIGYATTFKLFMDIFGVENKLVHYKGSIEDEHCFNLIKLDNEWYYVDPTWDDPVPDRGQIVSHLFFNVTYSYMVETDHSFEGTQYIETEATKYSYSNILKEKSKFINNISELNDMFEHAITDKQSELSFKIKGNLLLKEVKAFNYDNRDTMIWLDQCEPLYDGSYMIVFRIYYK